mgnify:CR=1 FL=1
MLRVLTPCLVAHVRHLQRAKRALIPCECDPESVCHHHVTLANPEAPAAAGKLVISSDRGAVYKDGKPLDLSVREFDILTFLAAEPGKVFSREQLMENVWGYEYYGDTRTVDVHVRHLRAKLQPAPSISDGIKTVRGVGYKIDYCANLLCP